MRYNCAKNMTYIPNGGVDMRRDTDRRGSTVQIAMLWMPLHLETFSSFQVPPADANYRQNRNSRTRRCFHTEIQTCKSRTCQTEFRRTHTKFSSLLQTALTLLKNFLSFSLHYLLGSPR
ncbi:hypothetical protein AMECASPLE_006342 [Ameca splendens]|uniref:Uncharacterized protein n=1 Tax=Ameca splendens TaxID=208324 RepID=A0ABV0YM20_9TELE